MLRVVFINKKFILNLEYDPRNCYNILPYNRISKLKFSPLVTVVLHDAVVNLNTPISLYINCQVYISIAKRDTAQ